MSFQRATVQSFFANCKPGSKPDNFDSECLIYDGPDAYNGYKGFRCVLAHRAAAAIYTERIPGVVRIRCGNKNCVRFEHLDIAEPVPPAEPKRSPLTNRALRKPVHTNPELIQAILNARPHNKLFTVANIAKTVHTNTDVVRKVLRESALYDLIDAVKELPFSIWNYLDEKFPNAGLGEATPLSTVSSGCS
jgi:hypothetical protein